MRYYLVSCLLWLVLGTGCSSPDFEAMAKARLDYARTNKDEISIVVFQDPDNCIYVDGVSTYLKGVMLAVDEINQRPGKLLGKTLKVQVEQDGKSFEASKQIIRRVANNPKITAVLGHADSSIAIPASVVYERSQMIFMPPFATAQGLTSHNFQYVFRMMPSVKTMTHQMVSVAKILGYKKIVILYARDDINRELAFLFEDAAIDAEIDLVQNSSFFEKDTNYRPLISQFNSKEFDAVFIAASPMASANMVTQMREMGIKKPILGNEVLNIPTYVENAGKAAENTIVPAAYRLSAYNARSIAFNEKYQKKYGIPVDTDAAQGYDSAHLLATAINKAGSTIPPLLSSTLHYLPAWVGVSGLHAFTASGEIRGKKYTFNVWQNGRWQILPAIHIPYLLERFEKSLADEANSSQKTDKNKKPTTVFSKVFADRLSSNEHKTHLLEFAQAILNFEGLGIIYEDTKSGKKASGYSIVQQTAAQKGFKVFECQLPFSKIADEKLQRELITCLGKLSLNIDTQYITAYDGVDGMLLNHLARILPLYQTSSLSLDGLRDNINFTLVLDKRSDVDPLGLGNMQVYRNLLNGIKVQDLADRMSGLPEIAVNLGELQKLGIEDDAILKLSPDAFMGLEE